MHIRNSALTLILAALAASSGFAAENPNIVYILADDLGYGDLGCYGQQKIETPNIDTLARNGMKFTQHYAFPVCAPSRYLLMTGKNSGKAYIRGNDEWTQRGDVWNFKAMEENPLLEGQLPVPDSTITISKVLQKAGYATGMVGKWGLGAPMSTGEPNNQGFSYFYGFICQRQDHTYYPGHLWENNHRVPLNNKIISPKVKFPANLDPLDAKNYAIYQQHDYSPDFLIEAALKFIEKNKQHPFFLYYPSPLPHVSLQAPQKWIDYYREKFGDEKPFLGGAYFPCRYPHAAYAAIISTLDEQVGEIVKKLKEENIYDNTIIMFCSDNGPTYNAGVDPTFFDSAGPFKGEFGWGKGFVHEGGIRVPFIVQWPDNIKSGSTSELISATIDMMPTLCDLLNIPVPSQVDGLSMLPTMLGKDNQQKKHEYLYFEYPQYGGQQAVRMGKWKAVRLNIIKKGDLKTQLFDLANDIQEQHDVADQHPEIIEHIEEIMRNEHHTPEIDTFRMEALESQNSRQHG